MSKHKNYSEFYNKKDETPVAEEPEIEVPTPEEPPKPVFETEVTPTEIIQKPLAVVKGAAKVNLRSGPSKNHDVITEVPENQAVKILNTSNEYWFQIEVNDKTGYMMSKFLKRV